MDPTWFTGNWSWRPLIYLSRSFPSGSFPATHIAWWAVAKDPSNENQSRSSSWYPMLITRSMMRAGEWRRWTVSSDANGNTCLCSHIQWAWSSGRQGTAADNVQLPHCILFNGSSVTSCQHKSHRTMLSFAKRSGMNVRLRLTTWHPINNTLGMLTYSDRKQFWAFVNLGSVWVCVGAASVWQLGNHLGTATSNQPPRRSVPTHS